MQLTFTRLAVGLLVPCAIFLALPKIQTLWRSHHKIRVPVADRLLRPPGESLRVRLDALNTDLLGWMMVTVALCVVATVTFPIPVNLYVILGDVVLVSLPLLLFLRTLSVRNDYWLGFSGECAVGEHLNELTKDGCHVFHDFPADSKWNIDHVVVAASGVYAVETKTRRKRKAPPGKEDHVVTFEDDCLRFPGWSERRALVQAKSSAKWLGDFLTKAVGEPVKVTPILTLPGWYIERKARTEFPVVNPKEIKSIILSSRTPVLDEQTMRRIAFQLDQKCRDVEF